MCTRTTLYFKGMCHSRRQHEYDSTGCKAESLGCPARCPELIDGPAQETGLYCVLCRPRARGKAKRRIACRADDSGIVARQDWDREYKQETRSRRGSVRNAHLCVVLNIYIELLLITKEKLMCHMSWWSRHHLIRAGFIRSRGIFLVPWVYTKYKRDLF